MVRIDTFFLEEPCSGSRRMVGYLARDGIPISRDRVQNLMRSVGLPAIYQKPRTTVPWDPSESFQCVEDLSKLTAADQGVGHGHQLNPAAESLSLPGGDRGHVLQASAQLEPL